MQVAVLTAVLVTAGLVLGLYVQTAFSAGAWLTGVLLLFAFVGRWLAAREQ